MGNEGKDRDADFRRNRQAAKYSVAFGMFSIVSAFIIPLLGLILGFIGRRRAGQGQDSNLERRARIGKIFSTIGIVLSIVIWTVNLISVVL